MPYISKTARKRRPVTLGLQIVVLASSVMAASFSAILLVQGSGDQTLVAYVLPAERMASQSRQSEAAIDHATPATYSGCLVSGHQKQTICDSQASSSFAGHPATLYIFILSLISLTAAVATALIAVFPPSWKKETTVYE